MRVVKGGGVGRYSFESSNKKEELGTGSEITEPKNAIFANHFEDKRGSRVNAMVCQKLRTHQNGRAFGTVHLPCNQFRACSQNT
jgi:hypothetical protein